MASFDHRSVRAGHGDCHVGLTFMYHLKSGVDPRDTPHIDIEILFL